jgi:hypothetical protein
MSHNVKFLVVTNNVCISSHVGLVVVRVFLEGEKVKQKVFGGPQAPSYEELNPTLEQDKPRCI